MLNRISTYIFQGNTFYGLEVSQSDTTIFYYLIKVKRKNNELIIEELHKEEYFDEILKLLEPSKPLCLTINTSAVISKGFTENTLKGEALANNLFPGLDYKNIWFESYTIKDVGFVSIIRKKEVSDFLEKLKKAKVQVFSISVGFAAFKEVSNFIGQKEVYFSNAILHASPDSKLKFLEKKVPDVQREYDINGLNIKSNYLLAFGSIVTAIQNPKNSNSNFSNIRNDLKGTFVNQRIFSLGIRSVLVFALTLLLINFLVFSYYYERVEKLREERLLNEGNIEMVKQLDMRVGQKEDRLNKALSVDNSKTSLFFDWLGENVPEAIQLDEIIYQPLIGQKKDTKPIIYDYGTVFITGITTDSNSFSDFIYTIQQDEIVENVETQQYDFKNRNSSFFKLKLTLKNEHEQ